MSARKVPLTKSGKPDKRYTKSVNSKSKATGKKPSKRLKTRRSKPQIKGYSANPVNDQWVICVVDNRSNKVIGYYDGLDFDTNAAKGAMFSSKKYADVVANRLKDKIPKSYTVTVVKK